jgi:hypothetical protein
VQKKEKLWRDLCVDVGTRREKTGIGWKESKEGAECAMKKGETIEHMWNGCSDMRKKGAKGKGRNTE